MVTVRALDHLVLNVADVERAVEWYRDQLGMTVLRYDEWQKGEVFFPSLRIDAGTIIDILQSDRSGQNVDHFCVVVAEDVDELARSGRFEVVERPADRWGARGDGRSLYVRDPDGNLVELRNYTVPTT